MRTPKIVIPHWLPLEAVTEANVSLLEHVTRNECRRMAVAGLILPAEGTGRIWRRVPHNRTDDATQCRSTLISTTLSRAFRETIVSEVLQRPLHEIDGYEDARA